MELKVTERIEERLIKVLLDVVILNELTKGRPLCGNDVIRLVHKKFGLLLSSGKVYPLLYSMEREGLIVNAVQRRRTVYLLTEKGNEVIKTISSAWREIMRLVSNIF